MHEHSGAAARVALAYLSVLLIFGSRHDAQIRDPVISWISVDVVNLARRPFTIMDGPRHPMRGDTFAENSARKVSIGIVSNESWLPSYARIAICQRPPALSVVRLDGSWQPSQIAGFGIVADHLTKQVDRDSVIGSHCADPLHLGQARRGA